MSNIKCGVEECIYNNHQGACTASEIEVLSNGNNIVGTVKGTMCATFEFERHTNEYGEIVR